MAAIGARAASDRGGRHADDVDLHLGLPAPRTRPHRGRGRTGGCRRRRPRSRPPRVRTAWGGTITTGRGLFLRIRPRFLSLRPLEARARGSGAGPSRSGRAAVLRTAPGRATARSPTASCSSRRPRRIGRRIAPGRAGNPAGPGRSGGGFTLGDHVPPCTGTPARPRCRISSMNPTPTSSASNRFGPSERSSMAGVLSLERSMLTRMLFRMLLGICLLSRHAGRTSGAGWANVRESSSSSASIIVLRPLTP